ncbi:MAG TPA: hypothetical protein VNV25_22365 [Gemmatimonadaceae bacterium]|jgi:bifunctional non-homologous end joining protein LigD|nr:hypothetical protein [Gemmatimonadaceae bacterium]
MTFVEPMLVKPVSRLPEGSNWQYEIKWDGYRALAIRAGDKVALVSRRNNSFVNRFPPIAADLRTLENGSILDGEIVAFDAQGAPSFSLLQQRTENARALVYLVFDVLAFRGRDVRQLALVDRRGLLDEVLASDQNSVRRAPIVDAAPKDLIRAVKAQGLEGIVAKRLDSRYASGSRSGAWVKFRVNKGRALVIGGYRIGNGTFDNLAVGYYDDRDRFMFVARIQGGFAPDVKHQIFARLRRLEIESCPFVNLPQPKAVRWGEALTQRRCGTIDG